MGDYEFAIKIDELFSNEMDTPANKQLLRMQSVRQMVEKTEKIESTIPYASGSRQSRPTDPFSIKSQSKSNCYISLPRT